MISSTLPKCNIIHEYLRNLTKQPIYELDGRNYICKNVLVNFKKMPKPQKDFMDTTLFHDKKFLTDFKEKPEPFNSFFSRRFL